MLVGEIGGSLTGDTDVKMWLIGVMVCFLADFLHGWSFGGIVSLPCGFDWPVAIVKYTLYIIAVYTPSFTG